MKKKYSILIAFLLITVFCPAHEALNRAAYEGDLQKVIAILQNENFDHQGRKSFGTTALHAAMFQKNLKILEVLIAHGFDINARGSSNGYTPLHDAVWADNLEAVQYLLERGADPFIKGKDGLTPYEKAKREKKTEITGYLEKMGISK